MSTRYDKFTERAQRVLILAQEEALRFSHNYIGTEHILLGLVREGDGVAPVVLDNLGVELNQVRSAVEFIIGRGDRPVLGEIGLTPRAKKVIELAIDEARQLRHHYIGTEHLLLGLVREGEGIAAGVLESLGVSLNRVRVETIRVLLQNPPTARQAAADRESGIRLRSRLHLYPSDIPSDIGRALSFEVRGALVDAFAEVTQRGIAQVEPEHLFLALLDGPSLSVHLRAANVDVDALRRCAEAMVGVPGQATDEPSAGGDDTEQA